MTGYTWFPGCKIPYHLPQYGRATRAVLRALDVTLHDQECTCCGWPVRHQSFEASIYSAARNLALAARAGTHLLTPCKCCFGNLKHAQDWLARRPGLRREVSAMLREEGLAYDPSVRVEHYLSVLRDEAGFERVRELAVHPLDGVRVAPHYGCHALRPSEVTRFDAPLAPSVMENALRAVGAVPVDWPLRLECCGNPLWDKNRELSLALARKKLVDAEQAGAEAICTACTYCQLQFDTIRADHLDDVLAPPAVTMTQLLGLALGVDGKELGLGESHIPWNRR